MIGFSSAAAIRIRPRRPVPVSRHYRWTECRRERHFSRFRRGRLFRQCDRLMEKK